MKRNLFIDIGYLVLTAFLTGAAIWSLIRMVSDNKEYQEFLKKAHQDHTLGQIGND